MLLFLNIVNHVKSQFRITFWLFTTLPAPYKALRSNAGAGNAGEGAVGMSVANDLGD
jgi:hypothetical protein